MTRREIGGIAGAMLVTGMMAGRGRAAVKRIGGVTRLSPKLDAVIDADAVIEELGGGFEWAEGPVWVKDGGYLLFSDVPANVIRRWSARDGVREWLRPSGLAAEDTSAFREPGSNGLAIDRDGMLLMADHGNRALARVDLKTKRKTILADRFEGKRFNSPNDVAIARSGAIYFTDPPYGLKGTNDSPLKELPHNGVYRRDPDGRITLVDAELSFPNGIALSPDERTLYVAISDGARPVIVAYPLDAGGKAGRARTFFDAAPLKRADAPGSPDGMKVDRAGNLFATGPGGVLVLTPQGEHIGTISTGRATANCAFGEDGRTLFLTADDVIARVRTRTLGL